MKVDDPNIPTPGDRVVGTYNHKRGVVKEVCFIDVGLTSLAVDIRIQFDGYPQQSACSRDAFNRYYKVVGSR